MGSYEITGEEPPEKTTNQAERAANNYKAGLYGTVAEGTTLLESAREYMNQEGPILELGQTIQEGTTKVAASLDPETTAQGLEAIQQLLG